jgi:hypothetical protein
MLTAPQAKVLLTHNPDLIPIILGCQNHFEIVINGESIAPQRMTTPPTARQFKTLAAAYSYLRNFLNYRGDVHIRLVDEPPTGTGTSCVQTLHYYTDF